MSEILHLNSQIDHSLYSTTRIEADLPGGTSTGTGFFVAFSPDPNNPDQVFPALITNKHVVAKATSGRILFHEADVKGGSVQHPSGERVYSEVEAFASAWVMHSDPSIDLAGAPLGKMIRDFERMGRPLFFMQIPESMIPSQNQLLELRVVDQVVMVGYPEGLADEAHGFPLFRHGYTSSHPDVNFNDRPLGALDIAVVPGSSGSPVITHNPAVNCSVADAIGHQPVLLGVLFGGPQTSAEGVFSIDPLPSVSTLGVTTRMFMNIGYYVKARELLPLKEAMLEALGIPKVRSDRAQQQG